MAFGSFLSGGLLTSYGWSAVLWLSFVPLAMAMIALTGALKTPRLDAANSAQTRTLSDGPATPLQRVRVRYCGGASRKKIEGPGLEGGYPEWKAARLAVKKEATCTRPRGIS